MTDPAPGESLVRWLVYVHPLWMLVALGLCLVALRAGLALRRAHAAKRPPPPGVRALHLRVAKTAVLLVLCGFVLGPLSVAWLRDWTPMSSFHALLGGGENGGFARLELIRDIAFAIGEGLLALIVGRHQMGIGFAHFDIIAEDIVETDLERVDARSLALAGLQAGNPILAASANGAQLI